MDDGNIGMINLHLYHGGKFIGENEYVGGKMELIEGVDSDISFDMLQDVLKDLGYDNVRKWGFRGNAHSDKFFIFYDEAEYCDNFYEYVNFMERFVNVYCESVSSALIEHVTSGLIEHEEDEEELNFTNENDSDTSDGMVDGDFSSDEEYLEARNYLREIRGLNGRGQNHNKYAKTCDHRSLVFEVGMCFKDFDECKEAIKTWAILNGYNIRWSKSDKRLKVEAKCEGDCPWSLYASKLAGEGTFVVKSLYPMHTCLRANKNRQVNCDWLADAIMNDLRMNANYPAKEIARDIRLKYDVSVDPRLCYKAKWQALKLLRGTDESHYSKLRSYISELQRVDRDGLFLLKTYLDSSDRPVFQRCYIGFSALKKGFSIGCRKCICFDACFLKTNLGGAVLSAITKDCNNKMFPISWAVVENECQETWTWFFEKLFEDLGIVEGSGWTFMSDKHRGIINGIRRLAPNAEHRHCARHIYANWRKKFTGPQFHFLFWEAVKCTNETQFKEKMTELKDVSMMAYEAFMVQGPSKFCKSLVSQLTKTDCIDNNICETFNSYILRSRDKPIIEMLEYIRKHLMTRMCETFNSLNSKTDLFTPYVRQKLNKHQKGVKYCNLQAAADGKYEVSVFSDTYIVDLPHKECTCRFWMLTGIPCSHALACIYHFRDDPYKYVDPFYLRENCVETYKHGLSPILGYKEWPNVEEPPILPPSYVKQPGRPKKNRRKDPSEVPKQGRQKLRKTGVKMLCKTCGEFGHNSKTCKVEKNIEAQPKGKRGRPRVPKPVVVEQAAQREINQARRPRVSNQVALQQTVQREIFQARQGFGVMYGESGNIYIGGRQVNVIHNPTAQIVEGSSQRSQVVDQTSQP